MTKKMPYLCVLIVALTLICCSLDSEKEGTTLCRINNYNLTLAEFERQLRAEQELDPEFKWTRGARAAFLEELIRKELLIQEAKKFKLDAREKFLRTIERYWEMTLIRDLIELKGKEAAKSTNIDGEAITARYDEMKKERPSLPELSVVRDSIQKELMDEQKNQMLAEWMTELRGNAQVEIDKTLL